MYFTKLIKSSKLIGTAALLSVAVGACASLPPLDPTNDTKVHWLNGGPKWTDKSRKWFHNASQGTATFPIPYTWFVSLEQPGSGAPGLFKDQSYLSRMGFIRSAPGSAYNKDDLPVGLARMDNTRKPIPGQNFMIDQTTGKVDAIGFTCAACHTGQINYKGKAIGIDGGQGNISVDDFGIQLLKAMLDTRNNAQRFDRFAKKVLGSAVRDPAARKQLRTSFKQALDRLIVVTLFTSKHGGRSAGFGRVDALTSIGNQVFGINQLNSITDLKLVRSNTDAKAAPVSFPFIWDASWFEWVQYDASIMSVSIRNSGEAMGVSAMVNMVTPTNYWDSTVKVKNIHGMETMLGGLGTSFKNTKTPFKEKAFTSGLWSPKWPQDILPKINIAKAKQGEDLYYELCASCHLPPVSPLGDVSKSAQKSFWDKEFWVKTYKPTTEIFNDYRHNQGKSGPSKIDVTTNCPTVNALGKKPLVYPWRLLRLPIIPVTVIGTDPAQAEILTTRTVQTPTNMGINYGSLTTQPKPGFDENLFALALGSAVQNVNDRWNKDNNISPKEAAWLNGGRPNCLQATMAYKARPLNGVWATAPFLHNGSIPTLYELLSPKAERRDTFWTGNREFDAIRVGYVSDKAKGLFKFKTSKPGNLNIGHEFTGDGSNLGAGVIGRRLDVDERFALVEFLKTQ